MKKLIYLATLISGICTTSAAQDTVNVAQSYAENVDTNTNQLIINGIMTVITIVLSIIQKKKGGKNGIQEKKTKR